MVQRIAAWLAALDLLEENLEVLGHGRDVVLGAGQRHHPGIEGLGIGAQHFGGVAVRVQRHKHPLQAFALRPQQGLGLHQLL